MPSTLPYWCEMWKSQKTPVYFFQIFEGFEFLVQTVREICQIFISSDTISVTWIILFVGLIYSCSPIAGWCLFVLLTVNKEIRQRKNKKKTKKNRAWSLLNSVHCTKNTVNWYKVQAVVVLCVGIYTQFPHKIKRLTPYLFMFINLGEKYFSTLEKKKGVVSLLLCTIVDRTFVIHAYFWLAFIYSCLIDTFHLGWLIIRWRGSYKSSERLPWTKLFGKNQQIQQKYTLCQFSVPYKFEAKFCIS